MDAAALQLEQALAAQQQALGGNAEESLAAAVQAAAAVAQAAQSLGGLAPMAWNGQGLPASLDVAAAFGAAPSSAASLEDDEDESDRAGGRGGGGNSSRMRRAPWSEFEEEKLKELAQRHQNGNRCGARKVPLGSATDGSDLRAGTATVDQWPVRSKHH